MFTIRSARAVLVPALIGALVPLGAQAQERELFSWNGRVDREVQLTVSPSRAIASPEASINSRTRFRAASTIPQRSGVVRVVTTQGRGRVDVIQQPSAENGYAAVVRIVDNEGGADNYRLTAYWTSNEDPRYGRNRDRRDDDDRNDRGNRDERNNRDDRGNNNGDDRYRVRENPPLLQWSGDVDTEIQLVWRNGAVRVLTGSGAPPRSVRSTISGAVGNQLPGQIAVSVRDGRGRVDVIQQPTAQNGYTGIIRIADQQSGFGHYTLDAYWR